MKNVALITGITGQNYKGTIKTGRVFVGKGL